MCVLTSPDVIFLQLFAGRLRSSMLCLGLYVFLLLSAGKLTVVGWVSVFLCVLHFSASCCFLLFAILKSISVKFLPLTFSSIFSDFTGRASLLNILSYAHFNPLTSHLPFLSFYFSAPSSRSPLALSLPLSLLLSLCGCT